MDVANDLHMGVSTRSQKQKRERKRKNQGDAEGPDFSLDNSSPKTDATIKHPLHESPALPNFLSCQIIVEYSTKNDQSKRKKTKHNDNEGNATGCDTPENTFSPNASTPALNMPSEHPIQCFSSDPITNQSGGDVGFCEGHNEENEQNMIDPTAENSIANYGVPEVSCNHISVATSPEPFAKDYVSEDIKLNTEHGYPSPDNCKKEPTVQDHHKDESHDSPLRVTSQIGASAEEIKLNADNINEKGFMTASSAVDFPTELLETDGRQLDHSEITRNDQGCGGDVSTLILETERAEEIELNIDNINEQRFMTISSAEGIPVEQVETNVRQLDHAEITRNDQCCAAKEIELNTDKINEQRFMTTSSTVDIPVDQLETNGRQLDHVEITRNDPCAGDVSDLSFDAVRDGHLKTSQFSLDRSIAGNPKNKLIAGNPKNKLLILDVNGLLADFVSSSRYKEIEPDFVLRGRKVYKRPFCDDFLQFCFDRFHVGVWSSRAKSNVDEAITFLMGKSAAKLLFCWNQSHCTRTKFTTVENKDKPLVLKELRKLWDKDDPDLPWEKGEFNESNTLLLDDSPYKALMNPMHSAIFPFSYRYYHTTDSELGPGGDLRVYLEGLATAENVQKYVSENPFGQRPIRETNPSWRYYRRVIEDVKRSQMWGLHHSGRR